MINNNKRAFEFYRREKQKLNETQSQKSEDQWLLRERTNNQRLYSIFLSAVSARELEIRDQFVAVYCTGRRVEWAMRTWSETDTNTVVGAGRYWAQQMCSLLTICSTGW
ncbi:hypothetical protein V6N13_025905 [Hibiscus sabdariffa]